MILTLIYYILYRVLYILINILKLYNNYYY